MGSYLLFPVALLLGVSPLYCADSALLFNKTFGGSDNTYTIAIATDRSGNVIVGGSTVSYDFPVTNGVGNPATQFAASGDSGATWHPLGNLPKPLIFNPATGPVLLAASPDAWYAAGAGIFKSTDGGSTWTTSLDGSFSYALAVDPTRPSIVYAFLDGKIVKTIDSGATWSATSQPPITPGGPYLAIDPFHPDHVFARNFRSFDGGQSWTPVVVPPPMFGCSHGDYMPPITFDRVTPDVAYLEDQCSLYRSIDGGVSWALMPTPFTVGGVAAGPQSGVLYAVSDTGLYTSSDQALTWTRLLTPALGNFGPRFVAVDPQRPSVIITDTVRSEDGGVTFTPLTLGRATTSVVFDPAHPGRALAITGGASMAFLAKLDPSGAILAATYLGGQGGAAISGVTTGADGTIYVTGPTLSRDFPVTDGAWLTAPPYNGTNYFVAAFDADLKPIYATYLGGGILQASGIAVDSNGSAIIAGAGLAGSSAVCVLTKLKPDGSGPLFLTFLTHAGTNASGDSCRWVAVDAFGNSILVGSTSSADFPLTGNGTGTHQQGVSDAFVAKVDPAGNLVYSGYLGGADYDAASVVATDSAGNIYVVGNTRSKDFPASPAAYQTSLGSKCPYPSSSYNTGIIGTITYYNTDDAFVTKLDPSGKVVWSTYLGGGCYDVPTSAAVDQQGNVWVTGTTDSDDFPSVMAFESGPAYAHYKGFVAEVEAEGGSLNLSSYLGGGGVIAVDPFGNAYIGGSTTPSSSVFSSAFLGPQFITGVQASLAKVKPGSQGPFGINSVGNAFTLRNGPVSPGQITRITADGIMPANPQNLTFAPQGVLPRTLADTQVLFDGEPAALVSVTAGQVVAVAPYDLTGKRQTSVQVLFQGTLSPPMIAEISPDPGYLTVDGSGSGQAYARNPDGTLNSVNNPAPISSRVTVYATGEGGADAACPEGGTAPGDLQPLGSIQSVPGWVCGIFQMRVDAVLGAFLYPMVTIAVK